MLHCVSMKVVMHLSYCLLLACPYEGGQALGEAKPMGDWRPGRSLSALWAPEWDWRVWPRAR